MPKHFQSHPRRVAPDGKAYTLDEFVNHYGGQKEWQNARPAKRVSEPCRHCGEEWSHRHTKHAKCKVLRDSVTVKVSNLGEDFNLRHLKAAFGKEGEIVDITSDRVQHEKKVEVVAYVQFREAIAASKVATAMHNTIWEDWMVQAAPRMVAAPAAMEPSVFASKPAAYTGSMQPHLVGGADVPRVSFASIMAEELSAKEGKKKADKPKAPPTSISCVIAREDAGRTVLVRNLPSVAEDTIVDALLKESAKHGEIVGAPRMVKDVGAFVTFRDSGSAARAQAIMHRTKHVNLGLVAPAALPAPRALARSASGGALVA